MSATLDIIIENWSRGDCGQMYTLCLGRDNKVLLINRELESWTNFFYDILDILLAISCCF